MCASHYRDVPSIKYSFHRDYVYFFCVQILYIETAELIQPRAPEDKGQPLYLLARGCAHYLWSFVLPALTYGTLPDIESRGCARN